MDRIKYSKTSHDRRSSAAGISAKTTKTLTKDERMQKFWQNAQQELNSSQKQEVVKTFYQKIQTTYDIATLGLEKNWRIYECTEIPQHTPTATNPDFRLGSRVNMKAIDATTRLLYYFTNASDVARAMMRIIWLVDKQPQTEATVDDVLANVTTSPDLPNFNALVNLNNQSRFTILSDEIHESMNACRDTQQLLFSQHIDVDFITAYKDETNDETTNKILVMVCPILCRTALTNQIANMYMDTRVTYTDA